MNYNDIFRSPFQPITFSGFRSITDPGVGGGGASFVPDAIFFAGRPGAMYDLRKPALNYQQNARSTLVNVTTDPMASLTDLSGNAKHTTVSADANRPTFQGAYGDFDGNDSLIVPTIDFSGTHAITVLLSVRKDVAGLRWHMEAAPAGGGYGFWILSDDGTDNYEFTILSLANTTYKATTYAAPSSNVIIVTFDTDGATIADQIIPLIDGVTPTLTPHVSTPSNPSGFFNGPLRIGSRSDGTSGTDGAILVAGIMGWKVSPAERAALLGWAGPPLV